jgi:hypothetical protein
LEKPLITLLGQNRIPSLELSRRIGSSFLIKEPFKKEVVVDLDSDSGIEEITEKSSDSGLASGC